VDNLIGILSRLRSIATKFKYICIDGVRSRRFIGTNDDRQWDTTDLIFRAIFEFCLNLITIHCIESNQDDTLHKLALEAVENGFLQRLEILPVIHESKFLNNLLLGYAIRDRLKYIHIDLPAYTNKVDIPGYIIKKLDDNNSLWLSQFPKLERFTLR
jgi:hypothetical protein